MKRLISALLLLPALALAAGNDMFIQQRDPTNAQTLTRTVTVPSADGIMGYAFTPAVPGNRVPVVYTFGTGLALSGGAVVALPQAWTDITGKPAFATVATSGNYADLSGVPAMFNPAAHTQAWSTITATPTTLTGYGITDGVTSTALTSTLAGYATTGALATGLAGKLNAPTGTTAQYIRGDGSLATLPAPGTGTVTSIAAGTGLSGGTITTSGTISMPNTGTAGSYANVTTDAQGRVTAGTNRSQVAATRALNTAFQISATRDAWVSYSVQITVTASIAGGQNGDVVLEVASDSGFTTNVQTLAISGLGQTYTLAVALQGVQPQTGVVTGYVPAGYYARLRTVSATGTPAFAYRAGQEVLQ